MHVMGVHMNVVGFGEFQTPNAQVEQMKAGDGLSRSTAEADRVLDRKIGVRFGWFKSWTLCFSVFRMQ